MATRKIIDAKHNGEKVWLKGHAQATFMSNGTTVEDAINQIGAGSGSGGIAVETDPIFLASPAASITEAKKTEWDNKMDKVVLSSVATSGNYNDLTNKPTIPAAVTESTVSGWGFTKTTGTYSKPSGGIPKSDLASDIQASLSNADNAVQKDMVGTLNIINVDGVCEGDYVYALPTAAAKNANEDYDDIILSRGSVKTINGESIVGSGDITISGGSSDANVQAVDTGDVLDDVTVDYATKTYVDGLVGDINSVLESIINS